MSEGRTLSARPVAKPEKAKENPKSGNLQDAFLNALRKDKAPVTMFLVKGVKLQGIITWFDNFSILLRRDGQSQLVYKHAISTIMPGQPMRGSEFPSLPPATSLGSMPASMVPISSRGVRMIVRSTTLRNWRTLPGQS